MDGIGLSNMMGPVQIGELLGTPDETQGTQEQPEETNEEQETAEVDFSDLLGTSQSESVGSGDITEGVGETPESEVTSGTPQKNLFSSIAKALRDEGVFPDLSEETLKEVKDATSFRKMFDDEVAKSLDDTQRSIDRFIKSGATSEEVQTYQQDLSLSQFLGRQDTYNTLIAEGAAGDKLRKQVMYQDYINHGIKHEKALKLIQKSFDDGTELEDAKEAFESCKEFYKDRIDSYQQEISNRQQEKKVKEEKQFDSLKKHILDKESFYDGLKVDKATRQKAYDSITRPIYKDENGNYLNALQKYQKEHPVEYVENVAMLFALTNEFKSVDKLAKAKAQAKIKSSFDEIANLLNNSKRNGDGTLNLANGIPDDMNRDNWEIAL